MDGKHVMFTVHSGNWLPKRDTSQTPQVKYCQLLIKIHKRRSRKWEISLDQPFLDPDQKPIKNLKNIARFALDVKTHMMINPNASPSDAAIHFKVSRARISQLLKIANNLPTKLFKELVETDDPVLLKKYSGKQLLKIAQSSSAYQSTS